MNESIPITIQLINVSKKNLLINDRCSIGIELSFDIISPSGKKIVSKDFTYLSPAGEKFLRLLKPNESISITTKIEKYYLLEEIGNYKISAMYQPYTSKSISLQNLWDSKITSKQKVFTIKE